MSIIPTSLRRGASDETVSESNEGRPGTRMIRLANVEKSYEYKGGRTWVLRRINLEIRQGDFVTIMGPSGAGKSKCIKRSNPPTEQDLALPCDLQVLLFQELSEEVGGLLDVLDRHAVILLQTL